MGHGLNHVGSPYTRWRPPVLNLSSAKSFEYTSTLTHGVKHILKLKKSSPGASLVIYQTTSKGDYSKLADSVKQTKNSPPMDYFIGYIGI